MPLAVKIKEMSRPCRKYINRKTILAKQVKALRPLVKLDFFFLFSFRSIATYVCN